jgi:hypothetical protein
MNARAQELEDLKRIDLRIIAAELGYILNAKRSSRASAVMDHPSGERILIAVAPDGHYVWCSVRQQASGSCIDLWQRHKGGSLGEVRRALRPFLGGGDPPPLPSAPSAGGRMLPGLQPVHRDIIGVRARYEGFPLLEMPQEYLCGARGLPLELLTAPPFRGRIRVDDRGNAIFPHYNRDGLCGWEARNHDFIGFAKGGTKGLWCSVPTTTDQRLVIAESAIDALSHAALFGHAETRYISFSGGLNTEQPALLRLAMERMTAGSTVVAAIDNDEAGDGYHGALKQIYAECGRADLAFEIGRPPIRGTDWNDALRASSTPPPPPACGTPEWL